MFYKMKNGLCPYYLASLVPATVGSASTYPLRNYSDLRTLHTNSCLKIHLSCLLQSVIGINFQSKLEILQALTSSKTDSTPT